MSTQLPALLESLTQSVTSALDVTPKVAAIPHSADGVSLLDVKNDLLLSYLQNLVFLIILKLRAARTKPPQNAPDPLENSAVERLVELRLYLEKGTRPLEDKMRYQIDMLLRAASEAERKASENAKKEEEAEPDSESDDDNADPYDDFGEIDDADLDLNAIEDARPRMAALMAPSVQPQSVDNGVPEGIYRAPRRVRALMEDPNARRRDREERRPQKSATLDEYIAEEFSSAPAALPSIGTNVVDRGRRVKTAAERAVEEERRTYEETNFVRLPSATKKEKARQKAAQAGNRMVFGGEDFRDIGSQLERIDRLTKSRDSGRGGNVRAMLERSRKRERDVGGGDQVGERFQKKARVMEMGRKRRR